MLGIVLLALAVITLALYVKTAIDVSVGGKRIAKLHQIPPMEDRVDLPTVSAVIPACNEERNIREALTSVLAQTYPRLQIVAVDDRSTDRTGAILDSLSVNLLSADRPQLRVVHIRELPAGWIGKNNALFRGAAEASGEWLLFADADVVMDPTVLARAMRYVTEQGVDHLAIAPRAVVGGFLANSFLGTFALLFTMHTRPWKVRDPNAREYIGIGAFNLVKRSAYDAVQGHRTIALRPDDDLQLGRILKRAGFRQDLVFGTELMKVEWYNSFAEMRTGLMKNMFAVLNYNLALAVAAALVQFILLVWPWLAILLTRGPVQWLNAASVLVGCVAFVTNSGLVKMRPAWCLATPIGTLVSMYLILRSAAVTLRNNGINWRGTHYSLAELRSQKVPLT